MYGSTIIDTIHISSVDPNSCVTEEEKECANVIITAVLKLDHYKACMRCKSRDE